MKLIEERMEGIVDTKTSISLKTGISSCVNGADDEMSGLDKAIEEHLNGKENIEASLAKNSEDTETELNEDEIDDLLADSPKSSPEQNGKSSESVPNEEHESPVENGHAETQEAGGETEHIGPTSADDEKETDSKFCDSNGDQEKKEDDKAISAPAKEKLDVGNEVKDTEMVSPKKDGHPKETEENNAASEEKSEGDEESPGAGLTSAAKESVESSSQAASEEEEDPKIANGSSSEEEKVKTSEDKASQEKINAADEPKPFVPKLEDDKVKEEADVPMETTENEDVKPKVDAEGNNNVDSKADIKADNVKVDASSDDDRDKEQQSSAVTAASPVKKVAALVPVSADDDTDDEEDEEVATEDKTHDKPNEHDLPPKEKPNYGKALEELGNIAQKIKALDDDDSTEPSGRKRLSSDTAGATAGSASEAKKPRTSKETTSVETSREAVVKKKLQKISRKELEGIAAKRLLEGLQTSSELGEVRTRIQDLEESKNKWMKKAQARGKMLQDLVTVVKRYIQDVEGEKNKAKPIIITRSVGLQVVDNNVKKVIPGGGVKKPIGVAATNGPRPPVNIKARPMPGGGTICRQTPSPAAPGRKPVSPMAVAGVGGPAPSSAGPSPVAKRPLNSGPMPPGVTISPIGVRAPVNLNTPVSISPNVSISRTSAPVSNVAKPPGVQLPKQPLPVAAVKQPPSAATAAAKKVIDVVDLSDDEEGGGVPPAAPVPRPVTTVAYTYGPSPATVAGGQTRQILLTPAGGAGVSQVRAGNYLIPVSGAPAGIQRQVIMQQAPGQRLTLQRLTHPAPPPDVTAQSPFVNGKRPPAQPVLKINCQAGGIVLSWDIKATNLDLAPTKCYQIYAYQENSSQPATSSLWKKVGDVKALPLPMACTLTQFSKGNRYHFAVRAEDNFKRFSLFSDPQSISLN